MPKAATLTQLESTCRTIDAKIPTTFTGATDSTAGSAGTVPAPIAGQGEYFLKANGSWAQAPSGGSGAGTSYSQITKLGVEASAENPKVVNITIPRTATFCAATPNVLYFVAGDTNIIETACGFDNGDAEDFNFNSDYVEFDGTMHPRTTHTVTMSSESFSSGYLYSSETINLSNYKSIESIATDCGHNSGIALLSAGGGAGDWAAFDRDSKALLVSNDTAYNLSGSLLAENWSSLTDTEKLNCFNDAEVTGTVSTARRYTHSISMSSPSALASGYIATSSTITMSGYEVVESIELNTDEQPSGIALIASGGKAGTWASFKEARSVLLVSNTGAVYDCSGTQVAESWSSLTDSEKESLFVNSSDVDFLNAAKAIGTFQVMVYANYETVSTCTVHEARPFSTFQILTYTEEAIAPICEMVFVPANQLVVPQGLISLADYETINSVTLTATTSGSADIRYAVTNNLSTYYTYNSTDGEWQTVTATAAGVIANGMTASEVAAVPSEAWSELAGVNEGLGFAYALSMTDTEEDCYVDAITLDVDMKGDWRAAVYGTEYTYAYTNNINLQFRLLASGNWKINYDSGS